MRLRASLGLLLLGTCGCAQLPEGVRVEVGDRAIELKKLCPTLQAAELADDEPRN